MTKGSTYLRKDRHWKSRISLGVINGKRQLKSFYGKTNEEAQNKLMLAVISSSEIVVTDMTVKELCNEWLMISKNRVKQSSLANYRMKIEKHIIPRFGDTNLCDLTSKSVYIFMHEKQEAGLSPRYVTNIIVLLKMIFKYAQREYGIKNPFIGITIPKYSKKEMHLLNADEQKKLKTYLKEHQNSVSLGITLALAIGLRIGEVCGLMWEDIDFKKRILTVRRTVQRIPVQEGKRKTAVIAGSPKSQTSVREISIPEGVFVMLQKMKSANKYYILSNDTKPVEPRKMQYQFAMVLRLLNLPSVKFHSLRHAMASNAINLGFDVKTLSEILGHSRIELTLNLYVHSDMDRNIRCNCLYLQPRQNRRRQICC